MGIKIKYLKKLHGMQFHAEQQLDELKKIKDFDSEAGVAVHKEKIQGLHNEITAIEAAINFYMRIHGKDT